MSSENPSFGGLRVASFESRRRDEMAQMIARFGGEPHVSPSLREVPLEQNPAAVDFAQRVITGQIDVVIFLTGVGTRHLVAQVERHVDRARFLSALDDMTTVVRGPKPLAVLRELGVTPKHRVPEPNTWRELLETLDEHVPVANQVVGLQEYGQTNPSLIAGLEARGATVLNLKVYSWDFPVDTQPLCENLEALGRGERDVAMFTSAHQVVNVLNMSQQLGLGDAVRREFDRLVIASIGPTTSEALRELGLHVDLEPEHPKMGHLVMAAAAESPAILAKKRRPPVLASPAPAASPQAGPAPWHDSPFLKACRREPTDVTPVWLMRQAGRYMPEYREVRAKTTFLELCKNPQLSAEVMITAVEKLGVDAAIIFSDLLPILEPMGMELEFAQGEGPVIHNPVRESADVDRVFELESVGSLEYVMETVRQTRAGLPGKIPLIGFAGAPFTLASYAIEGGSSRSFLHTKTLMYRDLGAWNALLGRLVRSVTKYLNAQIAAGAQAVQIFDSWVGCLGPEDYRRYVLPHTQALIDGITPGAPVIHFGTGNPALLPLMAEAGGQVIGLDWRVDLDAGWQTVGHDRAVQGNLDPTVLLADRADIRRQAERILRQAAGRPGHIFNLGHGVLQQTPPDNARALVDAVHELSQRRA
ncbi:MAG: uroporphyrinogen decarboxylase [Pirellulales bacterium]